MKTDGLVTREAFIAIKSYCESRNYKCRGCAYRIDKVAKDHSKWHTCIFGNCPCDWGGGR